MSDTYTDCLDCGHTMNHRYEDECEKCGSRNVDRNSPPVPTREDGDDECQMLDE